MKDNELRESLEKFSMAGTTSNNTDWVFGLYGHKGAEKSFSDLNKKLDRLISELGYEQYSTPAKSGIRKIKKSKKK